MSSIFLSPEVSVELFLEFLLLIVLSYAVMQTIYILKNYIKGSTSSLQYELEKKSYLVSVIVSVALIVKLLLVGFFAYTLDELSFIIPGAMCMAGVIDSNEYGEPLLLIKLFLLLLSSIWLVVNKKDLKSSSSKYFKQKMWFFLAIYMFILFEFLLSVYFYTLIETQNPVLCCGVIFKDENNPIPFNLSKQYIMYLFYILYLAVIVSAYKQKKVFLSLFSILFTYISYYALVYFFGAYIYELPTHKCPYCMLQKDYYYIGYFIYITAFLGAFYSLKAILFGFENSIGKNIIFYYSIFVFIITAKFVIYIISNGVFL